MNLTKYELEAARAIMCAIFPPSDPRVTEPIAEMDLEGFARYATSGVPFKPALGFRAVIWMTIFAPIFVLGKFKTFLGLSAEERDQVVDKLIYSSIYEVRALFVFFKAFTSLFFFTSARVREQVVAGRLSISGERLIEGRAGGASKGSTPLNKEVRRAS